MPRLSDFFYDFLMPVCFIAVTICAVILGLVSVGAVLTKFECEAKTKAMNIESQWGFFQGCMLNVNGQLLPWSEVVPVERSGKIVFVPKPSVRIDGNQR